ncbi:hypothetical protein HZC30_06735 [Candidatus Woesearchaeota archaeon]|nr:hypothetical protein [Candidatus Woesearchaeota archaeon]
MLFAQPFGMEDVIASGGAPPIEFTEMLQPLTEVIKPIITVIGTLLGGLLGVYILMLLVRWWYERKQLKVMEGIRYDLDYLNQHFNLPYSQKKPHKLYHKVLPLEELRGLEKEWEEKEQEKEGKKKEKEKEKKKKS